MLTMIAIIANITEENRCCYLRAGDFPELDRPIQQQLLV